jgi:hypothetical protein
LEPTEPIFFEKCPHLREKGGVLTLRTPIGFVLIHTVSTKFSTGALGHRLSAFLFLNFYMDFQYKILYGIFYTEFQNPLYMDFQFKFFPAVFGPPGLGWPPGGPAAAARVRARGDAGAD